MHRLRHRNEVESLVEEWRLLGAGRLIANIWIRSRLRQLIGTEVGGFDEGEVTSQYNGNRAVAGSAIPGPRTAHYLGQQPVVESQRVSMR